MSAYLIAMGIVYGPVLFTVAVYQLVTCFQRWRRARAAERIPDSVPDVPYLPLPDQQASTSGEGGGPPPPPSSWSCVICVAEHAKGDGRRLVMPGCVHAFHRGCIIAEWLRQGRTTCPICRATAIVVGPAPAGEDKVVAAAPASTAEV